MNNQEIDLVLMDMKLPELNGFDSTRLIKKFRPALPIIAVTACAMMEDRRRCKISGCDAYLPKPIIPGEFFPLVNSYLALEKCRQKADYSFNLYEAQQWI
jgi:two-component system, cell cycle response regulator DivK